jgi:uncharacterized protein
VPGKQQGTTWLCSRVPAINCPDCQLGRSFTRSLEFLIERDDIDGAVNLAAPHPLVQREFMAEIRRAAGIRVGLPASKWMLEAGAFAMRSDTELLLKSRRVIPGRLSDAGFTFIHSSWPEAAQDLVERCA